MRSLQLLFAQLRYIFQRDAAYRGNNFANLASATVYTVMFLLFLNVLFRSAEQIGPYSENDLYFLTFIGQMLFYLLANTSFESAISLADDINTGRMDYHLLRPLPHRLFLKLYGARLFVIIRDALPLILVGFVVDWSALTVSLSSLISGLVMYIIGLYILAQLIFSTSLVAFWTGASKNTVDIFWGLFNKTEQPYEVLYNWAKFGLFFLMPTFVPVAVAGSIMLQITEPAMPIVIGLLAALAWKVIATLLWKKGIRRYASASS